MARAPEKNESGGQLAVAPPGRFAVGYKDRSLEETFLDDLASISNERLVLGYLFCIFFVVAGPILQMCSIIRVIWNPQIMDLAKPFMNLDPAALKATSEALEDELDIPLEFWVRTSKLHHRATDVIPPVLCLLYFIAGLISTRFVRRRHAFYIVEAVFLAYIATQGYFMHYFLEMSTWFQR